VATEQADLHLLWNGNKIFVKPLPLYLLDYGFWETYLCTSEEVYRVTCGFVLSYIWLINSELDHRFAFDFKLLPPQATWPWWRSFTEAFLENVNPGTLHQVNKRFCYGELRLNRINMIYHLAPRLCCRYLIHGYMQEYNRYRSFLSQNFRWLAALFAYFSIALSAMQVGLTVPPLSENKPFKRASYGFVMLSVFGLLAVAAVISILFCLLLMYNLTATLRFHRKSQKERARLAAAVNSNQV
jgi:hypothetical protein